MKNMLWLAVESPWSALDRQFLLTFAQMGLENVPHAPFLVWQYTSSYELFNLHLDITWEGLVLCVMSFLLHPIAYIICHRIGSQIPEHMPRNVTQTARPSLHVHVGGSGLKASCTCCGTGMGMRSLVSEGDLLILTWACSICVHWQSKVEGAGTSIGRVARLLNAQVATWTGGR